MRVLKFRAWNKQKKKWMWPYPDAFHIIGEVTVFELLKQDCTSIEEYNDLEIVEFTGLKDKNGKEIYEGDIVNICQELAVGHPLNRPFERIVCWHKDTASLKLKGLVNGEYGSIAEFETLEIIGNIYEDKELLNDEIYSKMQIL